MIAKQQFANTDLFRLAASYYGDATLWTVIASANKAALAGGFGEPDPFITAPVTLVIPDKPAYPVTSDGVYGG